MVFDYIHCNKAVDLQKPLEELEKKLNFQEERNAAFYFSQLIYIETKKTIIISLYKDNSDDGEYNGNQQIPSKMINKTLNSM